MCNQRWRSPADMLSHAGEASSKAPSLACAAPSLSMLQTACFRSSPARAADTAQCLTRPATPTCASQTLVQAGHLQQLQPGRGLAPTKRGSPTRYRWRLSLGCVSAPAARLRAASCDRAMHTSQLRPPHQHSASVCAAPAERGHSCSGQGSGGEARRVLWTCWRTPALQRWCGCS